MVWSTRAASRQGRVPCGAPIGNQWRRSTPGLSFCTLFHFNADTLKLLTCSLFSALFLAALPVAGAAEHPGAVIYRKLCAECHGDRGQGVQEKYDEPLHGNRSVEALAKRIARTMPEDNVGACVGEDAQQVAAYIYDAFYSPQAHARLSPPELDLARLTIAQYRTSITDLVGRFRPGFDKPPGPARGLKAHYSGLVLPKPVDPTFIGPLPKNNLAKVRFDRTDATVAFNFGAASPDPAKLSAEEFSVRWEGSVLAEETGVHEFIVKSENGVRLWVNDTKKALIDGWVSSGPEVREQKKSVFLLGGRAYPVMLEFFKLEEKTASIHLQWRPPHGVVSAIPARQLSPERVRESMVVAAAFPADDRSAGYERGTGVSKQWDQATTAGAMEVAEHVEGRLEELAGMKANAPDRLDKLKQFARRFAEAAFRRPLTEEEYQRHIERQFAGGERARSLA